MLIIRDSAVGTDNADSNVADFYQGNSIRFIVPSSPGGGFDEYTRMLVPYLEKYSGASIKVINRPGAGGMLAANELFLSPKNGLTIGMMNGLAMVTNRLGGPMVVQKMEFRRDWSVLSCKVEDNGLMIYQRYLQYLNLSVGPQIPLIRKKFSLLGML